MIAWVNARRHGDDDRGSIGVLSLGFAVVAIMTILVVSAATAVHLQRMRLAHVADELAIRASNALDVDSYYAGAVPEPTAQRGVPVAQARMQAAVNEHVADVGSRHHLPTVQIVAVGSADGNTATVTVAVVVLPLFEVESLLPFTDGITLTATGSARSY